jgi:hypothetical protein
MSDYAIFKIADEEIGRQDGIDQQVEVYTYPNAVMGPPQGSYCWVMHFVYGGWYYAVLLPEDPPVGNGDGSGG